MTTSVVDSALIRCVSCQAINRVPVKRLTQNPLCGKCKTLLDFPISPRNATTATFEKELLEWPESVLVEFWSAVCDDCMTADPVLNDIAFLRAGRLKVLKVDMDAEPVLALQYAIVNPPVFLVLRNQVQIARLDGIPKENKELLQWVELHLAKQT